MPGELDTGQFGSASIRLNQLRDNLRAELKRSLGYDPEELLRDQEDLLRKVDESEEDAEDRLNDFLAVYSDRVNVAAAFVELRDTNSSLITALRDIIDDAKLTS